MSNYLIHYGVKGMKWGVRNDRRANRAEIKQIKKRQKLSKYQKTLAKRANTRREMNLEEAREHHADYKDLKKYGRKSEAWRKHLEKDFDERWEKSQEDKPLLEQRAPSYLLKSADVWLNNKVTSDSEFDRYVNSVKFDRDVASAKARHWEKKNKELLNVNVSDINSKKDLRKIYKGK